MSVTKCQAIIISCCVCCVLLMKSAAVGGMELGHGGSGKVQQRDELRNTVTTEGDPPSVNKSKLFETKQSIEVNQDRSLEPVNDEGDAVGYKHRRQSVVKGVKNRLSRVPGFQIFMDSVGLRRASQSQKAAKLKTKKRTKKTKGNNASSKKTLKRKRKRKQKNRKNKKRNLKKKLRKRHKSIRRRGKNKASKLSKPEGTSAGRTALFNNMRKYVMMDFLVPPGIRLSKSKSTTPNNKHTSLSPSTLSSPSSTSRSSTTVSSMPTSSSSLTPTSFAYNTEPQTTALQSPTSPTTGQTTEPEDTTEESEIDSFFGWVYSRLAPKYVTTGTTSSQTQTPPLPSSSSSSSSSPSPSSSSSSSSSPSPPSLSSSPSSPSSSSSSSSSSSQSSSPSSLSSPSPLTPSQPQSSSFSSSSLYPSSPQPPAPSSTYTTKSQPTTSPSTYVTSHITITSTYKPTTDTTTQFPIDTTSTQPQLTTQNVNVQSTTIVPTATHDVFETSTPGTNGQSPRTEVQNLTTMFESCIKVDESTGEDVIPMHQYIQAYSNLTKLFEQFGIALKLASDDIMSKLGFLNRLHQKDGVHYRTFESMFEYEFSTGDVQDGDKDSGVRSNRIIHRGLELFYRILDEIDCMGDNCKNSMSSRVRHHYDGILAPYHSYFVQSAAHFTLLAFPSRESMLGTLGLPIDERGIQQVSGLAMAVGNVYHKIESLYKQYPEITV